MKKITLLACLLLLLGCSGRLYAQEKSGEATASQDQSLTTIVLVRHAEKMADGSKDPQLSEQGHRRAKAFARMFSLLAPEAIYSSNYQRTISTAKPLAEQKGLSVQVYDPRQQPAFLEKVLKDHRGGTVVIIGHSNTVPFAVNHLLGKKVIEEMSETEYDKVFVVNVLPDGTASVLPLLLDL